MQVEGRVGVRRRSALISKLRNANRRRQYRLDRQKILFREYTELVHSLHLMPHQSSAAVSRLAAIETLFLP